MSARIRLTFASFVLVTTVGAAAIAVSGAGQSRAIQDVGPRIQASLREIPSPAPADSAQPQLTVSPAGRVLSSWLERVNPATGRRRFRLASLDGDQWSPARTIVEGDRFFANWADVPSIAAFSNGSLAAHWLQMNGPGRTSYDVLVSFSRDDGKSWTTPATPHRDGTETEHGFASFFENASGAPGLVWLDGRDFAQHGGGGGHGDGETALRAAIFDGAAPGSERLVDGRTCDCCPTAVAPIETGVLVAYRDRGADEIRDISVTRFDGARWSAPAPVHADGWKIPACPVNGPALASDGKRAVAVAWFTAAGNQGRVIVAFSRDAGATFGAPIAVSGAEPLGRVSLVMLPDGSTVVGWIEQKGQEADFRVRHVGPEGVRGEPVRIAALSASRASCYPRMVLSRDTLVLAWTDATDPPRVRTATARVVP